MSELIELLEQTIETEIQMQELEQKLSTLRADKHALFQKYEEQRQSLSCSVEAKTTIVHKFEGQHWVIEIEAWNRDQHCPDVTITKARLVAEE